ncbi:MAG: DNA polymerase III subunit gamma/tau [Ferrimicrobium sp.]
MASAYQSLYRTYRPQRFDEVLGQDHVTRALRSAVATGNVGHAYFFSGPRGTGKTSSARILAKALNCADPAEGEPCGVCDSCVAVTTGRSLDVEELDAASNSGVDAIRWLIQTVATAGLGRWKVYIIDEVHMLSSAAANALLKTLEEPPDHVVFILATTNPQKVPATVMSRTQSFEFHLLPEEAINSLVESVVDRSGLLLDDKARAWARHRGGGSARDTLSFLERVAASGGVIDDTVGVAEAIVRGIFLGDFAGAVSGIGSALDSGSDPVWLVTEMLGVLRGWFRARLGVVTTPAPIDLPPLAQMTRVIERLGTLALGMRDALDPGVVLEAVTVQLTNEVASGSDDTLRAQIAALEGRLRALEGRASNPGTAESPSEPPSRAPSNSKDLSRAASIRTSIQRSGRPSSPVSPPMPNVPAVRETQPSEPPSIVESSAAEPPVDITRLCLQAQSDWTGEILPRLSRRAQALLRPCRVRVAEPDGLAVVADNAAHQGRVLEVLGELTSVVVERYAKTIAISVVLETDLIEPEPTSSAPGNSASTESVHEDSDVTVQSQVVDLVSVSTDDVGDAVLEANVRAVFPLAKKL